MNCCKNSLSSSAKSVLGSQSLPPESRWLLYTFQHARKHCSQLDRRCEGALEGKCRTPRLPQLRAPRPARWLPAGLELSRFGQGGPAGSVPPRVLPSLPTQKAASRRWHQRGSTESLLRPGAGTPAHLRSPGAGQGRFPQGSRGRPAPAQPPAVPLPRTLRGQGPAAPGEPSPPPPPRIPGPPRWPEALGAQGRPPGARAILSPPSPAPLPGSPEATTARQRGSPALTEVRRDALPPPAACSPRPAARAIVAFLEKLGRGKERGEGRGWEGTEIEGERSMQRQEVETATTSAGD